ncbi:diaminopimelate epimerase [Spongisporangium articulatum]|uniref:Diaminopimelate epimerase n=1 Tax=Spongisporangium articulatum TaxID=3362603 RepID=A0ABW8AML2_9ACTN
MSGRRVRFAKGHGTQNDFVLLDDPDAALDLAPALVRTLADRHTGLGGDGVIRVVRSAALADEEPTAKEAAAAGADWFMDYRNADGSVAEMCGNGVRVLVAYLLKEGRLLLPEGATGAVGTRGGVKAVRREGGPDGEIFAVGMGPWRVDGGGAAVAAGGDVTVRVGILTGAELPALPGLSVDLGNPHVVVLLPDLDTLRSLDLSVAPRVEPVPPHGANVEFVVPTGEGQLAMRVHERGVGETRSCGTGAVAAAAAVRAFELGVPGAAVPDEWLLDVPGGRVRVRFTPGDGSDGGAASELAGPARLVAEGELLHL